MREFPTVDILGFPVSRLSMEDTVAMLAEEVEARRGRGVDSGLNGNAGLDESAALNESAAPARRLLRVVTANAEILYAASRHAEQGALLKNADIITPDGVGAVKASIPLGRPVAERVAGVDLLCRLCAEGARRGWSAYLLGAAEESAAGTAKRLRQDWPELRLLGWHNGYFDEEEKEKLIQEISGLKPDLLFVALGFPAQDRFVEENRQRLGAGLCVGVGGSFDVLSGRVRRAPRWIQKIGMEWAYRFAQNPKRLGRFWALPKFSLAVRRQAKRQRGNQEGRPDKN